MVQSKSITLTPKQLLKVTGGRDGGAVVIPKKRSIVQPTPVVKFSG